MASPARLWDWCSQAGAFRDDCVAHVTAQQLSARIQGSPEVARDRPVVDQLAAEWSAATGQGRYGDLVWRAWWTRVFDGLAVLDPSLCAEEAAPVLCLQGLATVFQRRYHQAVVARRQEACAHSEQALSSEYLAQVGGSPLLRADLPISGAGEGAVRLGDLAHRELVAVCAR